MQILDSGSSSGRVTGAGVAVYSLGGHFNTVAGLHSSSQNRHRFAAASSEFSSSNRIVVVDYDEDKGAVSLVAQSSPINPVKHLLDFSEEPERLCFLLSVRDIDTNAAFVRIAELDSTSFDVKVAASSEPLGSLVRAIAIHQESKKGTGARVAVVHPGAVALLEVRGSTLEHCNRYEPKRNNNTISVHNHQELYSSRFQTGKFDPHHKDLFACACGDGFELFDWRQVGEPHLHVRSGNCHLTGVLNLDFNPNVPNELVTAGDDGKIAFWDLRSAYEPIEVLEGNHKNSVHYALFNPFHDQLLLSGGPSTTLLHVRSSDPKLVHQSNFTSHTGCWSISDAWHFAALSGDKLVVETIPSSVKYKLLL